MTINILYFVITLACVTALAIPMGHYLAKVFTDEKHTLPERLTYRLLGVDPDRGMRWSQYGMALVLANAAMLLLGYLLLRVQAWMPLNPLHLPGMSPDLAFNTAVSFVTNTNWQAYSGENTLSNFSQMAALTFLMTVSATTGLAAGAAFVRGLGHAEKPELGNFWADFTRIVWRILLPICFVLALVCVWQGVPQTLASDAVATTLEGAKQHIILGAVASLETIKHIGTNGGGFFGANAAHPYEDPTPLINTLHILSMLLIPAALTVAFGRMLARDRQGWVLFGAFFVMFVGFLAIVYPAEQAGNPQFTALGVDQHISATQPGGNMEGKEMRFGIAGTSLFVTTTTAATTGSVNAMHDSLTPLGGLVPLGEMMLNCVYGGKGVGLINLLQYAILAVFLIGMMIGRTPEFLGKKIEAREIKLVMLAVLAHPICILGFTALAVLWPHIADSLGNTGPHGFSEILYAYTSATANNGSAFGGLSVNTPFYNTTIGLAMLIGRYGTLLPMLAVAGLLASKKTLQETSGTFPTATPLFMGLTVLVTVVVGGLTFLPALALGPLVEHIAMLHGQLF